MFALGSMCYNPVMSTTLIRTRALSSSSSRRRKLVRQVRGKYAHVRTSSASFAAGKQREISKEAKRP